MVMAIRLAPISQVDAEFAQKIIDLLRDQPGEQFTESDVARRLHVYPLSVKPMLALMLARGCVELTVSAQGVRTYAVVPALQQHVRMKREAVVTDFKPLSQSYLRMMAFVMEKR